jgi:hypothetical protein
MADSSRHSIYAIIESVYGTTPATPAFNTFRHTGTNLGLSKGSIVSEELRSDRQIPDVRGGAKQIGGDITTELSYSSFDEYLEATLGGTWAAKNAPYSAATISAAASDQSINDSANAFPLYAAGDIITISGFTGTTANNSTARVVSSTISKIVVVATVPLVNDAAGESVTVTSGTQVLKAGVVRRSFTLMRYFSDIAGGSLPYYVYRGVEFSKWQLTVAVNAIIKQVFSVLGKAQDPAASTAPAGSSVVAPTTTSVLDSFGGSLKENGSTIAVVTEIQTTLDNGLAVRNVIGSDETLLPSIGRSNLTGQITAYFEDSTLVNKFVNETYSSLDYKLADLLGNAYQIVYPRIKYTGGQPDTQGQGAITLAMPFQALYDATTQTNILIYKHPKIS